MTVDETLALLRALTGATDSSLDEWNTHPRVGSYKRSAGHVLKANGNCVLVSRRGSDVRLHASIRSYAEPMSLGVAVGVLLGASSEAPAKKLGQEAIARGHLLGSDANSSGEMTGIVNVAALQRAHEHLTATSRTDAKATPSRSPMLTDGNADVAVREYFANVDQQDRALEACRKFLGGMNWPVEDRLKLYDFAYEAFRSGKGIEPFRRIYAELVLSPRAGGWGIARNAAGPLWTADRTFEAVRREFSPFQWGGSVTLLNIAAGDFDDALLPAFEKMRSFKPVSNWPVMAVSKILHFYNPELFPVYDNEVVWNKVLKHYRGEFKAFCWRFSSPYSAEDTPILYRNYMRWGNSLMSCAHPQFMQRFAEWLARQPNANLNRRAFDASKLYSDAFEFTIIGAYAAHNVGTQSGQLMLK